jgi:hypothetical protein
MDWCFSAWRLWKAALRYLTCSWYNTRFLVGRYLCLPVACTGLVKAILPQFLTTVNEYGDDLEKTGKCGIM